MLLQVILAGFKRSNLEMNSVSSILLGYLLPKVNFKSKVAIKFASPTLAMKPCSWFCCWPKKLHMGVKTAEFLVEVLVELLKSLEDNNQTSTFRVRLQSVLENVEKSWPEVYRVAMVRGEREGRGHSLSSRGGESFRQAAGGHKTLSSSQVVQTLATRLIVDMSSTKSLNSNNAEQVNVLECDTTFLLSQLEPARLEILLLNSIRITGNFSLLQDLSVAPPPSSLLNLIAVQPVLELQLLPLLFTSPPSTSSIIPSSPLARSSSLLSSLSSTANN